MVNGIIGPPQAFLFSLLIFLILRLSSAAPQCSSFSFNNPIYHFTFDSSSLNSTDSPIACKFLGNSVLSPWSSDRFNRANSALSVASNSNNALDCGALPLLPQGTASRSFSFWYRCDSKNLPAEAGGEVSILGYGKMPNPGGQSYYFDVKPDNFGEPMGIWSVYSGGVGNLWTYGSYGAPVCADGSWQHFYLSFSNFLFKFYLNGQFASQNGPTFSLTTDTEFFIGSQFRGDGFNRTWPGDVDDIRIYNRQLSDAEVLSLWGVEAYGTGFPIASAPPSPLSQLPRDLYHFTFDQHYFDRSFSSRCSLAFDNQPYFTYDRFGRENSALDGNRDLGVVSCPLANLPIGSQSRSISVWFRCQTTTVQYSNIQPIFGWGEDSPNQSFLLYHRISNKNYTVFTNDVNNIPMNLTDRLCYSGISPALWRHVVLTYENSSSLIALYLDGSLSNSYYSPQPLNTSFTDLYLSYFLLPVTQIPFTYYGRYALDDVHIYNRALSAQEIQTLYEYEKSTPYKDPQRCGPGFSWAANGTCLPCLKNQYSACINNTACSLCGNFTWTAGQTGLSSCYDCPTGWLFRGSGQDCYYNGTLPSSSSTGISSFSSSSPLMDFSSSSGPAVPVAPENPPISITKVSPPCFSTTFPPSSPSSPASFYLTLQGTNFYLIHSIKVQFQRVSFLYVNDEGIFYRSSAINASQPSETLSTSLFASSGDSLSSAGRSLLASVNAANSYGFPTPIDADSLPLVVLQIPVDLINSSSANSSLVGYKTVELFPRSSSGASVAAAAVTITRRDLLLFAPDAAASCSTGYFVDGECFSCPHGGICVGGGRVYPKPGYWSFDELTLPIECPFPPACPGASLFSPALADGSRVTRRCAGGYSGTSCTQCAKNYYSAGPQNRCRACGDSSAQDAQLATFLTACAILFGLLIFFTIFLTWDSLWFYFLLIGRLQLISIYGQIASSVWPENPSWDIGASLFEFISLTNFNIKLVRPGCKIPYMSSLDVLVWTLWVVSVAAVGFLIASACRAWFGLSFQLAFDRRFDASYFGHQLWPRWLRWVNLIVDYLERFRECWRWNQLTTRKVKRRKIIRPVNIQPMKKIEAEKPKKENNEKAAMNSVASANDIEMAVNPAKPGETAKLEGEKKLISPAPAAPIASSPPAPAKFDPLSLSKSRIFFLRSLFSITALFGVVFLKLGSLSLSDLICVAIPSGSTVSSADGQVAASIGSALTPKSRTVLLSDQATSCNEGYHEQLLPLIWLVFFFFLLIFPWVSLAFYLRFVRLLGGFNPQTKKLTTASDQFQYNEGLARIGARNRIVAYYWFVLDMYFAFAFVIVTTMPGSWVLQIVAGCFIQWLQAVFHSLIWPQELELGNLTDVFWYFAISLLAILWLAISYGAHINGLKESDEFIGQMLAVLCVSFIFFTVLVSFLLFSRSSSRKFLLEAMDGWGCRRAKVSPQANDDEPSKEKTEESSTTLAARFCCCFIGLRDIVERIPLIDYDRLWMARLAPEVPKTAG